MLDTRTLFVCRVIESCKTFDQLKVAANWAYDVLSEANRIYAVASVELRYIKFEDCDL